MRASIIICTYNRAASLARTLETLAEQAGEGLEDVEVLVVDNNSNDGTGAVVQSFLRRLPLRSCREPAQGLGHARKHPDAG